jgi:hypothetical protein
MPKDLIALLTVLAAPMWAGTWTLSPPIRRRVLSECQPTALRRQASTKR